MHGTCAYPIQKVQSLIQKKKKNPGPESRRFSSSPSFTHFLFIKSTRLFGAYKLAFSETSIVTAILCIVAKNI